MNNVISINTKESDKIKTKAVDMLLKHNIALKNYVYDSEGKMIEYSADYEETIQYLSNREQNLIRLARLVRGDEGIPRENFNIKELSIDQIDNLYHVIKYINRNKSTQRQEEV